MLVYLGGRFAYLTLVIMTCMAVSKSTLTARSKTLASQVTTACGVTFARDASSKLL